MNLKTVGILMLVTCILSVTGTRYLSSKGDSETSESTKEVVRNDVKTIERTIERPDGTKETTKETVDKSTKKETTNKEVVISKKDWMVSAIVTSKLTELDPVYGIMVQRRIIGPVYLGLSGSTDKRIGINVGLEF